MQRGVTYPASQELETTHLQQDSFAYATKWDKPGQRTLPHEHVQRAAPQTMI